MQKDGAQAILFRDKGKKEVFLIKRTDFPIWVETGGGIEKGEKPSVAVIREAEEETGFKIKLGKHVLTYTVTNKIGEEIRKEYIFEGRIISGEYRPEFQGNIGKWFPVNKLPFNISKATKIRLKEVLRNINSSQTIHLKRKTETIWDYKHLMLFFPLFAAKLLLKNF